MKFFIFMLSLTGFIYASCTANQVTLENESKKVALLKMNIQEFGAKNIPSKELSILSKDLDKTARQLKSIWDMDSCILNNKTKIKINKIAGLNNYLVAEFNSRNILTNFGFDSRESFFEYVERVALAQQREIAEYGFYYNEKYSFKAKYSKRIFPNRDEFDNGNGIKLISTDKKAILIFSAKKATNANEDISKAYINNLKLKRDEQILEIKYQAQQSNWYIIMGYNKYAKTIVYEKRYFVKDGDEYGDNMLMGFVLKYPLSQQNNYNRIIRDIKLTHLDVLLQVNKELTRKSKNYPFVCYRKKNISAGKTIYNGCVRSKTSCKNIKKFHFGRYTNDISANKAFKRCYNSNPQFVDVQGL